MAFLFTVLYLLDTITHLTNILRGIMLNFKKIFSLCALLSLSIGANASIDHGNIGTLGPAGSNATLFINSNFQNGPVDDIYFFTISTGGIPSIVVASSTSIVLPTTFEIENFTASLTDASGTNLTALAGSGATTDAISVLDGVVYGLLLQGNAIGNFGGAATSVLAITAVPVPASIWLLGSALFGLVGASSRSRRMITKY